MIVGQAQREKTELQATRGASVLMALRLSHWQPGIATAVQVLPAGAEWRD